MNSVRETIESAIDDANALGLNGEERIGFCFGHVLAAHCQGDLNLWLQVCGTDENTLREIHSHDDIAKAKFKNAFGCTLDEALIAVKRHQLRAVE